MRNLYGVFAPRLNVNISNELNRLEKSLERNEDIREDFWRIVGRVKRQGIKDENILKRITRIRDEIFGKRIILSYNTGKVIFSSLFVLFNILMFLTSLFVNQEAVKAGLIFFIELAVLYFAFLTGRCVAARISGIEVDGFYRYTPLELGVKVNYLSYLKARQIDRVVLYSGAILLEHVTMFIHTLFLLAIRSGYWTIPAFFLVINLPFSYIIHKKAKTGELHRLLREYRILREVRAKSNK